MTSAQIDREFDVVWQGRDYLCVFLPPVPKPIELRGLELEPDPPSVGVYDQVWAALPGDLHEIRERTGLGQTAVYTSLAKMRRQGKIHSLKSDRLPVVYTPIHDGVSGG
jgi:hypothetical protein